MRVYGFTTTIIMAMLLLISTAQGVGAATISGRMLMKNGTPLSGGIALAFDLQIGIPPAPKKYFRLPDYTEQIQNNGSFRLHLPQGEYAIGAVKRRDGKAGPPQDGDIFFLLRDEQRNIKRVAVPNNDHVDLGDMAAEEIFRPVSDPLDTITSVSGTVTDSTGTPVSGAIVSAVLVRKGVKDMLFFSQETNNSGIYLLKLPLGDTYNLGIWETGPPEDASKNFNKTIQLETGNTLQNVDLQMQ